MNDDDIASVSINSAGYPLTSSSAGYNAKILCGASPGPDGVSFSGGNLVGVNSNLQGNYSYQDVQFYTNNVNKIVVTGISGAGWGFAGVLVNCPLISVPSEAFIAASLFPNPTTGTILIQGTMLENAEVTIINELGKSMRRMKIINNSIDISDFPQGIYSLLIEINNQITVRRFIKI
jgi:hypothetical protein